jgi:hypothetical protein
MTKKWTTSYVASKYLKKHEDGLVDWSEGGMQMLNALPETVAIMSNVYRVRGIFGDLLMSRGFKMVEFACKYELSDSDRLVSVEMDSCAVSVVRNRVTHNFPMHYELGSDELCDLWEMIRKAWNADD